MTGNARTPPSPSIPAKSLAGRVALSCSREERRLLKPIAILLSLRLIGPRYAPLSRSAHWLAPSVSFCSDPLADIGWTIFQLDALRFTARQELHGIAIDQCYVLQIERHALTGRFQTKKPLQLGNVLDLDSTAQRKDHSGIGRPLNSQHGFLVTIPPRSKRRAICKILKRRRREPRVSRIREIFATLSDVSRSCQRGRTSVRRS